MKPDKTWPAELKEAMKDAYHGTLDLAAARAEALSHISQDHQWHQEGPFIICTGCVPNHSQTIGVDKNLKRNERGEYVITNRF